MPARRRTRAAASPSWRTSTTPRRPRAPSAATSPYLRRDDALAFMAAVRERALGVLERADLSAHGDRLNANGFVWDMLVQHEHQHNETMLQTLQLAEPGVFAPARPPQPGARPTAGPRRCSCPAARSPWATPARGSPTTTSGPAHEVDLPAFEIDRDARDQRRLRRVRGRRRLRPRASCGRAEGWDWRVRGAGASGRCYWTADGRERRFDRVEPLDPRAPGDARVAGTRPTPSRAGAGRGCPTEAEWEKAAAGVRSGARATRGAASRRRPSGPTSTSSASGRVAGDTARRAPPRTASRADRRLLGVDGERTSTATRASSAFPYPEYSEVFFGADYRVLRGGSWATRPSVAREHLPQLGPPAAAADLRRLPLRAGTVSAEPIQIDCHLDDGAGHAGRRRARRASRATSRSCRPSTSTTSRGSELFDRITTLPEYYPTRCEREILNRRAPEIVSRMRRSWWSWARAWPRRPARCSTRWPARGRCGATCPSTSTPRWWRRARTS